MRATRGAGSAPLSIHRLASALAVFCALAMPAGAGAQTTHLVVVSGLAGEPRYEKEFREWSGALVDAALERGLAPEQVVYLAEKPELDPARIDGRGTREGVERALGELAARAAPTDGVLLVLIGHGSADGGGARINLPGPDLTASQLAGMLDRFPTQRVVVANTASASGDFQEPLAGPNRAVITATKSGLQRNAAIFGGFFAAAFGGDGADADKDGQTSVLEAFEYARREVERFYKDDGQLQSEHAVLGGDAELARRFVLAPAAPVPAGASAELKGLLAEKRRLEGDVEALKARKDSMERPAYEAALEALLVELALTARRIREAEAGG